jgi:hypothetical protein
MKRFLILPLVVLSLCGYTQSQSSIAITSDFEVNYPRVSFTVKERNFDEKRKLTDFTIKEGNSILAIDSLYEITKVPQRSKRILFLWENEINAGGGAAIGQFQFTRRLLRDFLKDVESNDKFQIADFSMSGAPLLKPLLSDFTNSRDDLINAVDRHRDRHRDTRTNIFSAVSAGVDLFGAINENEIGVIVLITAGVENLGSGGGHIEKAINDALRKNIPVYTIRYSYTNDQEPKTVDRLAKETFGRHILANRVNYDKVLEELKTFYRDMNKRQFGHDYRITYKTSIRRDGKLNEITLLVKNEPVETKTLQLPMTFKAWVQDNLIFAIGLAVALIGLIVGSVLWIKKRNKKQQSALDDLSGQNNALQGGIDAARAANDALAAQIAAAAAAAEEEKRVAAAAAKKAAEDEEINRLMKLMHTKNLRPRLQYTIDNQKEVFDIQMPVTTIGRNKGNDLVLSPDTVSREHAVIKFNGSAFELQSLPGKRTVLNGQFIENATLKNGDKFGLGEVTLTYYQ